MYISLPTNLATMIEANRVLRDDSMASRPGATQQCVTRGGSLHFYIPISARKG